MRAKPRPLRNAKPRPAQDDEAGGLDPRLALTLAAAGLGVAIAVAVFLR
jgi:hypothetical protein